MNREGFLPNTPECKAQTPASFTWMEDAEAVTRAVSGKPARALFSSQLTQLGEEHFRRIICPAALFCAETDRGATFDVIERNALGHECFADD